MVYKWYGSLQACHNPVVIPSSSIHIIVGLLRYRPLSQATCYHFVQITSLTPRHGTHYFLGLVERHCKPEQSVRRKDTTQQAYPHTQASDSKTPKFNGETMKPPRFTQVINNTLLLARKYAQIYLRGHYLFRVANSFL